MVEGVDEGKADLECVGDDVMSVGVRDDGGETSEDFGVLPLSCLALWASLGLQGSPSRDALFDMIKLGAAVKQSPTTTGIDPLCVVDVVLTEASGVSSQTPVPVAEVAEGLVSPSEHLSREELTATVVLRDPATSPPSRPADLPSPFEDADALYPPPEPAIAQAPVPSGHKGLERKSVLHTLKRQVKPSLPHAAAAIPDLALQRSPASMRAPVPVTRQGSPARPHPTAPRRPPAVPNLARQRSPAHMRPPAFQLPPVLQRPPVPAKSLAVQEAPRLAHRHSQVPLDSQRPFGVRREGMPIAHPDTAHTRSPTRQLAFTSQRAIQEVPKLALTGTPGLSFQTVQSCTRSLQSCAMFQLGARFQLLSRRPNSAHLCDLIHAHYSRAHLRTYILMLTYLLRRLSAHLRSNVQTHPRTITRLCTPPPCPVLLDTCPRATAHSRPTVPHQPRAISCTPPRLKPPRHRAHVPAPSPTRHRLCAIAYAPPRPRAPRAPRHQPCAGLRDREIPMAHDTLARDPGQGPSRDLQRDHRQADRSSSHSPPRKHRTVHSPEEGRFPDRAKDSLISASFQANPRLSTPPRDRTIPFPPEGVSDSATVRQQPWFGTLVRALMHAMKPVLSNLCHKSVAAASPLERKRGFPSVETPPRAILSPRRSLHPEIPPLKGKDTVLDRVYGTQKSSRASVALLWSQGMKSARDKVEGQLSELASSSRSSGVHHSVEELSRGVPLEKLSNLHVSYSATEILSQEKVAKCVMQATLWLDIWLGSLGILVRSEDQSKESTRKALETFLLSAAQQPRPAKDTKKTTASKPKVSKPFPAKRRRSKKSSRGVNKVSLWSLTMGSVRGQALRAEIKTMFEKDPLQEVVDGSPDFYSRLFLQTSGQLLLVVRSLGEKTGHIRSPSSQTVFLPALRAGGR
ncbi:proteoglycan 4-like [Palaemon carinicauda]|uniref:proteoglycan 4-like n=1 Tax=Palaemon carinicauda TaxID=392227 RepID=UPI0035B67A7F